MHLLETTCNHARTDDVGRLPSIMLEQARPPAAGQDRIREHETGQIQQLPHVIAHPQMLDGEIHHLVGILPCQGGRTANAQVFLTVLAQGSHDGTFPQQGFNHQRLAQVAIIIRRQP